MGYNLLLTPKTICQAMPVIHTYILIILYFDTLASSTSAVFHEGRVITN
jgi:hypothetical protein